MRNITSLPQNVILFDFPVDGESLLFVVDAIIVDAACGVEDGEDDDDCLLVDPSVVVAVVVVVVFFLLLDLLLFAMIYDVIILSKF